MVLYDTIDKPPVTPSTDKRLDNYSWHIVINPNKATYTPEWYSKFKEGMGILFQDGGGGLLPYLRYVHAKKIILNPDMSRLKQIKIWGAFEKGEKQHRAHLDLTVCIKSKRGLYAQLNYDTLPGAIEAMCPGANVKITGLGKLVVESLRDYSLKGVDKNWPKIEPTGQTFSEWLHDNSNINEKYLTPVVKMNTQPISKSLIRQILEHSNPNKEYLIDKVIDKNGLVPEAPDIGKKIKAILLHDERVTDKDVDDLISVLED